MHFIVCASILLFNFYGLKTEDAIDNDVSQITASGVASELIYLLGHVKNETKRISELKEKLNKIDTYVVDREKYLRRIKYESQVNDLNSTNFYDALIDKDAFQQLRNESKNLYLKLKENMNRDDLLKILSDRGKKDLQKYARRMLDGHRPSKQKERALDEAVDKYLGEMAEDDHRFKEEAINSKYWDPEAEIHERLDKRSGRRIFKGERSHVRNYPFMVSIHIMGRFWCGGAIYWNDLIITSASCLQLLHNNRFFRENPRSLQVRVGSNHSRVGGELIDALEVYFHPAYVPKTLRNNIAVIRLRRLLKFSYHRVPKMIEISRQDLGVPFTAEVLLLGWGVTKLNQKLAYEPIFLQAKRLPIYPNKFCEEVYGKKFVTHEMFCAGTVTTGEGACDHDAGGPAILDGKLVGIISFGPAVCGFPDAPTVFTLVGAYTDWLETVNETMPEYYRGKVRTTTTTVDPYLHMMTTPTKKTTTTPTPLLVVHTVTTEKTTEPATITTKKATPPAKTTTEDVYFELPPGAVERAKDKKYRAELPSAESSAVIRALDKKDKIKYSSSDSDTPERHRDKKDNQDDASDESDNVKKSKDKKGKRVKAHKKSKGRKAKKVDTSDESGTTKKTKGKKHKSKNIADDKKSKSYESHANKRAKDKKEKLMARRAKEKKHKSAAFKTNHVVRSKGKNKYSLRKHGEK